MTRRLHFRWLLHQGVGEGATPFPGLLHFTFDAYLIMLSVKQGGIKNHFLSLWYHSTWDWTQVSRDIGEHTNCYITVRIYYHLFVSPHSSLLFEFLNELEIICSHTSIAIVSTVKSFQLFLYNPNNSIRYLSFFWRLVLLLLYNIS